MPSHYTIITPNITRKPLFIAEEKDEINIHLAYSRIEFFLVVIKLHKLSMKFNQMLAW